MKKNAIYYLVKDLLNAFPATTDSSVISTLNQHLISKEAIRLVFKDEVKEKKPQFTILRTILIVQDNFLRQFPQGALYEVTEILNELEYCYKKDSRKTIKKLSSQVILRLFVTLYFEFRILPMHHKEDEEFIKKFKEHFSKKDIEEIMVADLFLTKFIFKYQYMDLGSQLEIQTKLKQILNKF